MLRIAEAGQHVFIDPQGTVAPDALAHERQEGADRLICFTL
jgi:hypothetical protein